MSETVRSHPFQFLTAIFKKKRAYERSPQKAMVQLFSGTLHLGSAELVDESEGGAKVTAQSSFMLEDAVFLLKPATGCVHKVELAWREGCEAGFRYAEAKNLRLYLDEPSLLHIAAYWAAIRLKNGSSEPGGGFGSRR